MNFSIPVGKNPLVFNCRLKFVWIFKNRRRVLDNAWRKNRIEEKRNMRRDQYKKEEVGVKNEQPFYKFRLLFTSPKDCMFFSHILIFDFFKFRRDFSWVALIISFSLLAYWHIFMFKEWKVSYLRLKNTYIFQHFGLFFSPTCRARSKSK